MKLTKALFLIVSGCVVAHLLLVTSNSFGQLQPIKDLNGDGVGDLVFPRLREIQVRSGPSFSTVIRTLTTPSASPMFGHTFCFVSDVTNDGVDDLLVFDPGATSDAGQVGCAHLFNVVAGAPIWTYFPPEGYTLSLGCASVPGPSGQTEVLLRLAKDTEPLSIYAVLLNSTTGVPIRLARTPSFAGLVQAMWDGRLARIVGDLSRNGSVNTTDLISFVDAFVVAKPEADLDLDGVVGETDVVQMAGAMRGGTLQPADWAWSAPTAPLAPSSILWNAKSPDGKYGAYDHFDDSNMASAALSGFGPGGQGGFLLPKDPCGPTPGVEAGTKIREMREAVSTYYATSAAALALPIYCFDRRQTPGPVTTNGCGTSEYHIDWICAIANSNNILFTPCCNTHDICYGTCGSNKAACDALFAACMYSACNGNLACAAWAHVYYGAVQGLGQSPYDEAQAGGCICCDPPYPDPRCGATPPGGGSGGGGSAP